MEAITQLPLEVFRKGLSREKQVLQITSLSKPTVRRMVLAGEFPAPFYLSKGIKVWRNQDVLDWLDKVSANDDSYKSEGA